VAGEPDDDGGDDEEEASPAERASAFFNFLGLSELDYPQIAAQAVRHALQPRAWAPAPATDPQWLSIGPRNVGGRVIALAQDPDFPQVIYAGSAQGGLWRSPDAGNTWVHLGGPEHNYPVGAIAVARPDLVYIGTGEHLNTHVSGRGLFKVTPSTGAVESLLPAGQEVPGPDQPPKQWMGGAALRYTRIVVDPDEPLRFWYGAQNGVWRVELMGGTPQFMREWPSSDDDLPAQQDTSSRSANWPSLVTDLALARHPTEDRARYLLIVAGVESKGIYVGKFDRNDASSKVSWSSAKSPIGLDGSNVTWFGRVRVALCKNQPQHLYAVFCDYSAGNSGFASAVFRSDDAGDSWSMRTRWRDGDSAQAEYDLVLECSPGNPRRIIGGDINLHMSEDGGDTWKRLLEWWQYDRGDIAQHADQHAAMFDATDRRKLWLGNDGGLSIARDLRSTSAALGEWRKMSHGISGAQFYRLGVNGAWPWMTGGGLQDNGTYLTYGGHSWMHIAGGDGGAFAFDTRDARRYYVSVTSSDPDTGDDYVNLAHVEPVGFGANVNDLVMNDVDDRGIRADPAAHYSRTQFDNTHSPSLFTVAKGPFTGLVATHPDPTNGNIVFAAWRGQLLASSDGGNTFQPVTFAGGVRAPMVFELVSAIAFGRLTGAGPSTAETWFGTSSGLIYHAPTTAGPPAAAALLGPFAAAGAPPWPGGAAGNMAIETIAVNRTNDDIVAIGTSARQGPVVTVRVSTAGAPAAARFQFVVGNGPFAPAGGLAPAT
jgi:hypothetical protein